MRGSLAGKEVRSTSETDKTIDGTQPQVMPSKGDRGKAAEVHIPDYVMWDFGFSEKTHVGRAGR